MGFALTRSFNAPYRKQTLTTILQLFSNKQKITSVVNFPIQKRNSK